MAREPRSTSTFTPGLSYIDSISNYFIYARVRTEKLRDGNQP